MKRHLRMFIPQINSSIWISFFCVVMLIGISAEAAYIFHKFNAQKQTAGQAFYTLTEPDRSSHTITLTSDGFQPADITIRQGESIVFTTQTDKPYWPASDNHPTHTIYPEFDPRRPIQVGETWSFQFQKAGRWKYHDHLDPDITGTITVLTPGQVNTAIAEEKPSLTNCVKVSNDQKQQCWNRQLELMLNQQGLNAAFDFFIQLYNTEPDIPKDCHEWGHSLGKSAYEQYKKTGQLIIRPEASYCGYGYFHSFISEMLKDTGQFEGALEFCKKADAALKDSGDPATVHANCVHGVGHGTTAWLFEDTENWGNFQKVADQGTSICEKLFTEETDRQNCFDGVFNELTLDLFNDEYNLSYKDYMEKNDPFWICEMQTDEHRRACYFEASGMFWRIFNWDLNAALGYAMTHTDDLPARGPNVIAKISADWMQHDIINDSNESNIKACRLLPKPYYDACYGGLLNGFVQHGNPADIYDRAFKFCNADYITEAERAWCYKATFGSLKIMVAPTQYQAACLAADQKYIPEDCKAADKS